MTGIKMIAIERHEQLTKHGRSIEKDVKENRGGKLVLGAISLIAPAQKLMQFPVSWDNYICNRMMNKSYIERLAIAGALIAAEIDRIQNQTENDK